MKLHNSILKGRTMAQFDFDFAVQSWKSLPIPLLQSKLSHYKKLYDAIGKLDSGRLHILMAIQRRAR